MIVDIGVAPLGPHLYHRLEVPAELDHRSGPSQLLRYGGREETKFSASSSKKVGCDLKRISCLPGHPKFRTAGVKETVRAHHHRTHHLSYSTASSVPKKIWWVGLGPNLLLDPLPLLRSQAITTIQSAVRAHFPTLQPRLWAPIQVLRLP